MPVPAPRASSALSGRYAVFGEIASGGMASVLYGRLLGPVGFARPVAIKRLHPHIAREPGVQSMFIDEAHICARVSHANVVPTLDVIEAPGELALVMEYVHGATLETLLELGAARGVSVPLDVAAALLLGVLHGLSAAHLARNDAGELLGIVHRDVSPQNVLVGVDGVPRVLDFGIAKARGRLRSTPSGEVKGKLLYMAPEQLSGADVDARVDVYGAAVVLWELLTGRTLFAASSESAIIHRVLHDPVPAPSALRAEVSPALDALVLRGLARDPEQRFPSAAAMIAALEQALPAASQPVVSSWLYELAGEQLRARAEMLKQLQRDAEVTRSGDKGDAEPGLMAAHARLGSGPSSWERDGHLFTRVRARRQRLLLLGIASAFALLALALWLGSGPRPAERAPAAKAPPAPTLPAAPVRPAAPTTDNAAPSEPPGEEPHADPRAVPEKPAVAPEPAAPKQGARPSHKPKRDCREPYVIDAQGVKRWKRECL